MTNLEELKWRGLVKDVAGDDIEDKINNEKVTFYWGTDPTADSLHLGHYSSLITAKRLMKMGHNPILLCGGATGRIGDPRPTAEREIMSIDALNHNIECIKKQGIEANDKTLSKEYIYNKIHNKHIPIKTLLLDQTIISGLGNIYANEVLFSSHINPERMGSSLSLAECESVARCSNKIIDEAIKYGGTTIKSYTSSLGVTGRFQQFLNVHKKENEPCPVCNIKIVRIKIGGRSTYYCPNCQK